MKFKMYTKQFYNKKKKKMNFKSVIRVFKRPVPHVKIPLGRWNIHHKETYANEDKQREENNDDTEYIYMMGYELKFQEDSFICTKNKYSDGREF
jgi:hypothetical protein